MHAPMLISILICSNHAPASTDELLDSIAGQGQIECIEVVFVDNGLADERAADIRRRLIELPCRTLYLQEPIPGIWHARRRAIASATGNWLFTLDDDNILEPRAVAELITFCSKHKGVGGITPRVRPRWRVIPPAWLQRFGLCCLSYTDTGNEAADGREVKTPPMMPPYRWSPGGGMIIRREAGELFLKRFPELPPQLVHRRYTAEDQLLFHLAGTSGLGYAYVPSITVFHDLPPDRLRYSHLIALNIKMLESYGHYERYMLQSTNPLRVLALCICVLHGQLSLMAAHPATWPLVAARMYGFLKTYFRWYGALFARQSI
jgi:glycosyltransferase involved in cell wall biosynthesis